MATDPANPAPTSAAPEGVPVAPLAGTRSQAMQRLQIGLFGLAAMVLMVALANIINSNREQNEATVVPEAAPTVAAEPVADAGTDPLAEAGVVPDLPAQPGSGEGARENGANDRDNQAR